MWSRQSRNCGGMTARASARMRAIRAPRVSAGGTECSCCRPVGVDAHFTQLLRRCDPVPDEIVTAVADAQVVVQSGDGIADDLLLPRKKKSEMRENALAGLRREIGLVGRAAPDEIAGID